MNPRIQNDPIDLDTDNQTAIYLRAFDPCTKTSRMAIITYLIDVELMMINVVAGLMNNEEDED